MPALAQPLGFRMRLIPSPVSLFPALAIVVLVTGCGTSNPCKISNPAYVSARDRPRLQMPDGVPGSERLSTGGLVIPSVAPDTAKLDPAPRCLDEPPSFFGRKGVAADSAEEAVNAWAAAWASRKPDAVAAMYSPQFQAVGEGGSSAFLEERRQQVGSGKTPEARLEDMSVTAVGADRRIVTFVQRFGDDAVRKELTLLREANGWRIAAERTLDVP
jgi:hypothetical protein